MGRNPLAEMIMQRRRVKGQNHHPHGTFSPQQTGRAMPQPARHSQRFRRL